MGEYISIGCLALMRAVENFDPDKGISFSTYAYKVIKSKLLKQIKNRNYINSKEMSINNVVEEKKDSPNNIYMKDNFAGKSYMTTTMEQSYWDNDTYKAIESDSTSDLVIEAINELKPQDRLIIKMLYGIDGYEQRTQTEIAKQLNLSRQNLNWKVKRIMRYLKRKFINKGLS